MNGLIFPQDKMTSRERLLAAYHGQEVDRLPYWAKVANSTWRTSQPEAVRAWSDVELLDYIHADGIFGSPGVVFATWPHVSQEKRQADGLRQTITHTPDGDLVERWAEDVATHSWHPVEFPVKTREDIRRFRWLYQDVQLAVDSAKVAKAQDLRKQIGQRGVLVAYWGTSPLMHLVEHVIGPADVHLMLADYPDEMNDLIERMHRDCMRFVEVFARESPADFIISVENTSTTLISPQQFQQYCYKHLCDYGRIIRQAGKEHELHMCGHTRALLPLIDTIPAASIEAYTSPTLGNTRLVDGRTCAPSKTFIGGTNVMVWLWPIERIQQYILEELAACPDHRHIILTTAGVAAPGCTAETFRQVGEWLRTVMIRV